MSNLFFVCSSSLCFYFSRGPGLINFEIHGVFPSLKLLLRDLCSIAQGFLPDSLKPLNNLVGKNRLLHKAKEALTSSKLFPSHHYGIMVLSIILLLQHLTKIINTKEFVVSKGLLGCTLQIISFRRNAGLNLSVFFKSRRPTPAAVPL